MYENETLINYLSVCLFVYFIEDDANEFRLYNVSGQVLNMSFMSEETSLND